MITSPFAPLTQEYEKCHYSSSTVFLTQLGVSVGNLSAITPFCVIVFIGLVGLYQYVAGIHIPAISYSKTEKDDALNAFAVSLLVARDKYFRQQSILSKYEMMSEGPIVDHNRLSTISKHEQIDKSQFSSHMYTEIDATMLNLVLQLEKQGIELDPSMQLNSTANQVQSSTVDNPMVSEGVELQSVEQGRPDSNVEENNEMEKPLLLLLNTSRQPLSVSAPTTLSTSMTTKRPPITVSIDDLQSYSSLMTFISRLNYQYLHLKEEKQKSVAHRHTTEQEYWKAVEQTAIFHKITLASIDKMVEESGERLLYHSLLSLMEVHACLAFDCESTQVQSKFAHTCGYKFLDQTISYAGMKSRAHPAS